MRRLVSSAVITAVLGLTVVFVFRIAPLFLTDERARQQVVALYNNVRVGETRNAFLAESRSGGYDELSVVQVGRDDYVAKTRWKFGSQNWHLYVSTVNDVVTSVKVRSSDDFTKVPQGAPADKFGLTMSVINRIVTRPINRIV